MLHIFLQGDRAMAQWPHLETVADQYQGVEGPTIGLVRPFPVLLFGPFRLDIAGRLLERNGMPINVGSRAFDILVALALRAGHIVRHDELMTLVWANVTVAPVALRGQIASLRKVLGDKRCGARYIINVTGRGYCFVATVEYAKTHDNTRFPASGFALGHTNAPSNRATETTA